MENRTSKENYYLDIAQTVAERGTCLRKKYGAIIVKNDVIIATGYNGASRGNPNCSDLGYCYREANDIPHGEQYEKCKAVHAEMNAIISASRDQMIGATLFLAGWENGKRIAEPKPCDMCERVITNAGIRRVITKETDIY